MNLTPSELFGLSILLPGIVSMVRYRNIHPSFHPFVYLLWVGVFNDLLSIVLIQLGNYSTVNNNIYVLLESLAILWLFKRQGSFVLMPRLPYLLGAGFVVLWVVDSLFVGRLFALSSGFRIGYSFVTVLLSINTINWLIVEEVQQLWKNALFVVCCCYIVFFGYKALLEIFWLFGLRSSQSFRVHVYTLFMFINLFINLVYLLVILWIPRRLAFLSRSS